MHGLLLNEQFGNDTGPIQWLQVKNDGLPGQCIGTAAIFPMPALGKMRRAR